MTALPVVFRLVPRLTESRSLLLDEADALRLERWYSRGDPSARPGSIRASWLGEPTLPRGDYPCPSGAAPILSRRMQRRFGDELRPAGELVPVIVDDADDGDYVFFAVTSVVDCLDARRSSPVSRATGEIHKLVFVPERVPTELPAFRIPQSPSFVFWNRRFVDRLLRAQPIALDTRVVWSQDPAFAPFPAPMRG